MAVEYGNSKIVTSGLVVSINAADKNSYPGSGTTWFDTSGNKNNFTLFNTPTLVDGGVGGAMQFVCNTGNQTLSQYATCALNYSTTSFTMIVASRYTPSGTCKQRVVSSISNNWLLGHWNNSVGSYYAEGWISAEGAGGTDTNWRIYSATEDYAGDKRSFRINNSAVATDSTAGSNGFNGISLGRSGAYITESSECQVSFLLVYNRVLTSAELTQNYEVLKVRFRL